MAGRLMTFLSCFTSATHSARVPAPNEPGPGVRPEKARRSCRTSPRRSSLAPVKAEIAIVGAGYVGMPLAQVFADAGKSVVLVDVNEDVVDGINRGESHIPDVSAGALKKLVDAGGVAAALIHAPAGSVPSV